MPDEETTMEAPTGGEIQPDATADVTPEPEPTAAPETLPTEKVKLYTEDDHKAAISREAWEKREAKREAQFWRDKFLEKAEPPKPPADLQKPNYDDYDSHEAYLEALADYKTEVKWREKEEKARQEASQAQMYQRAAAVRQWIGEGVRKYPDFEDVIGQPDLQFTEIMGEFLGESPFGHQIAYNLARNPAELSRIASLGAAKSVLELQKLEAGLKTPPKTTTSAPSPTSPVTGGEHAPKALEDMDYEDYKAKRMREMYGGA